MVCQFIFESAAFRVASSHASTFVYPLGHYCCLSSIAVFNLDTFAIVASRKRLSCLWRWNRLEFRVTLDLQVWESTDATQAATIASWFFISWKLVAGWIANRDDFQTDCGSFSEDFVDFDPWVRLNAEADYLIKPASCCSLSTTSLHSAVLITRLCFIWTSTHC